MARDQSRRGKPGMTPSARSANPSELRRSPADPRVIPGAAQKLMRSNEEN